MTSLSNTLAAQAEDVKTLVAEADAAAMTSITKSLEAGALLIAAKEGCGHGNWHPFLARAGVQERKAQRLMKLAKSGFTSDCVSDLGGITSAIEFLSYRDLPSFKEGIAVYGGETLTDALFYGEIGMVWPSKENPGYFHCAAMLASANEEAGAEVLYIKRPIRGAELPFKPAAPWLWLERHMRTPRRQWQFWEGPTATFLEPLFEQWLAEDRKAAREACASLPTAA